MIQIKRCFALSAAVMMLLVLLSACAKSPMNEPGDASASSTDAIGLLVPESPSEPDYVSYPGFIDQHFTLEHPRVHLSNDEENVVSFVFTLSDSKGTILFTSEPVPPGGLVKWDVTQRWKKSGHHQLTIRSTPVHEDGTEGNSVTQTIKVYLDF